MIVSLILFFIAGCLNAFMDVLKDRFSVSKINHWNANFWDASISWKNKYINGDPLMGRVYWECIGAKIQKPVFLTDGWHLIKSVFICITILSVLFYNPTSFLYFSNNAIRDFFIFRIFFGAGFVLIYNYILL